MSLLPISRAAPALVERLMRRPLHCVSRAGEPGRPRPASRVAVPCRPSRCGGERRQKPARPDARITSLCGGLRELRGAPPSPSHALGEPPGRGQGFATPATNVRLAPSSPPSSRSGLEKDHNATATRSSCTTSRRVACRSAALPLAGEAC